MVQNHFNSYPNWFRFLNRLRTQNRNRSQWEPFLEVMASRVYTPVCSLQSPVELRTGLILWSAEWLLLVFPSAWFFWIWFCLGDYTCKSNNLKEKRKKDNEPTILSSITLHPLLPPLQEITMTSLTKQFAHCQALKPYKWVFWLWGL